jgi:hypothetical protein
MNLELKKFLKFIAIAVLLVWIVDFLAGSGLSYLHGRMNGGERARAYYAVNKSKADVYIFGSSRALYHYNPQILQDSLGMSVYNAGRSAQTVLYHLPVLKMIIKRLKPKLVILDINENEFVKDQTKYDLVNSLLPYYTREESVRKMIDLVKPGYRYFAWSKILPYNSSALSILTRNIKPDKGVKDINGYIYVKGHKISSTATIDNCNDKDEFDPVIINAFNEFVRVCKDNNIELRVFVSPRFANFRCERTDLKEVDRQLKLQGVAYTSFVNSPEYVSNENYMYDVAHLNYEGSIAYSREIAHLLKHRKE